MTDKVHIPEVLPPDTGITVHAAPHPFRVARIQKVVAEGMTLEEILQTVQPDPILRAHAHILLDDLPIPRPQWDTVRPQHGQTVIVRTIPQGGKNPFRILLQIAVVAIAFVAAPYLGAALGGALGLGTLGTGLITSAISGAILAGGTALINAIAPIRPPSGHEEDTDSPNYFIDQARNQARPFAPVPSLLGRHRIVPPLGAQTYTEVVGDHQYLRMLIVWGYGPIEITNMRIGETPITNYENVDVEHFVGREGEVGKLYRVRNNMLEFVEDTGTEPTLYPQDVTEEQIAVELRHMREQAGGRTPNKNAPDGGIWVQRTTAVDTDEISLDLTFPRGIIEFSSTGEKETMEIRVQIAYRKVGDATWLAPTLKDSRGNTAPRAATNILGMAITQPPLPPKPANGRQPDAPGEVTLTFIEKTTEAVRRGAAWATPERAQYEVRVRRISEHDISPEDFDEVHWTALRSFTDRYPVQFAHPLCMTALKIQGTNQLHGAVDTLNGEGGAFILDWNGTEWAEAISSNPASIFRHILQGPARATPTPNHQIDLVALQEWHDYCVLNGFEYNAIRDFRGSVFDALSDVAAAGQASPHYRDGKWTVVVDTGAQEPVQAFGSRNASGFSAQRHFQDVPHALRVRFSNRDEGWRRDERIVYNDGYTVDNAEHFITLDAPGITDPDHIWKWGRFHLAQIILRRETWTFDADFEFLVASRGDRITIAYDSLLVGQQPARILSLRKDASGNVLEALLDERISMQRGQNYGVAIRTVGGNKKLVRPVENMATNANPLVETNGLIFSAAIPAAEGVAVDNLVFFGRAGLETIDALISEIKPGTDMTARITALPFQSPGVYEAATQAIPPYVTGITPLAGNPVMEILNVRSDESTLAREGDILIPRILVEIVPIADPEVIGVEAQIRDSNSMEPYYNATIQVQTPESVFIRDVEEGATYDLRLRWGLRPQDFRTAAWADVLGYTVVGRTSDPPALMGLALSLWDEGLVLLRWNAIPVLDVRFGGEIRFRHSDSPTAREWGDATSIGVPVPSTQTYVLLPMSSGVYMARVFDSLGKASPVRFVATGATSLFHYVGIVGSVESVNGFFPGMKTNLEVSNMALVLTTGSLSGTYLFRSNTTDIDTVQRVRVTAILIVEGTDNTDAWVEMRTTSDDPGGTNPTWSAWRRVDSVENVQARGFEFRLQVTRTVASDVIRIIRLGMAIDKLRFRSIASFEQNGDVVTLTYDDGSIDTFTIPGLTVTETMTDAMGNLVVTLSDGTSFTVSKGDAGRGIMTVERMGNFVVITYDDGTMDSLPLRDGKPGLPGPSASMRWNNSFGSPRVTIEGGGGSGATGVILASDITNGRITRITPSSAGSGYTSPPTVTITSAMGSGARARVNPARIVGGRIIAAIDTFIIDSGGSGYAVFNHNTGQRDGGWAFGIPRTDVFFPSFFVNGWEQFIQASQRVLILNAVPSMPNEAQDEYLSQLMADPGGNAGIGDILTIQNANDPQNQWADYEIKAISPGLGSGRWWLFTLEFYGDAVTPDTPPDLAQIIVRFSKAAAGEPGEVVIPPPTDPNPTRTPDGSGMEVLTAPVLIASGALWTNVLVFNGTLAAARSIVATGSLSASVHANATVVVEARIQIEQAGAVYNGETMRKSQAVAISLNGWRNTNFALPMLAALTQALAAGAFTVRVQARYMATPVSGTESGVISEDVAIPAGGGGISPRAVSANLNVQSDDTTTEEREEVVIRDNDGTTVARFGTGAGTGAVDDDDDTTTPTGRPGVVAVTRVGATTREANLTISDPDGSVSNVSWQYSGTYLLGFNSVAFSGSGTGTPLRVTQPGVILTLEATATYTDSTGAGQTASGRL